MSNSNNSTPNGENIISPILAVLHNQDPEPFFPSDRLTEVMAAALAEKKKQNALHERMARKVKEAAEHLQAASKILEINSVSELEIMDLKQAAMQAQQATNLLNQLAGFKIFSEKE